MYNIKIYTVVTRHGGRRRRRSKIYKHWVSMNKGNVLDTNNNGSGAFKECGVNYVKVSSFKGIIKSQWG